MGPSLFLIGLHGIVSLALGSFFGMLVYRAPRGESILKPPSHCPQCKTPLKWYDNIPIFSLLWLGAKCRHCHAQISLHYIWIEALSFFLGTALAAAHFLWGFIPSHSAFYSFFILVLWTPPLMVTDFKHFMLPDFLTYSGVLLGLVLALFPGGLDFYMACLSSFGMAVFIFLLGWIVGKITQKEALGLGDVKLVAMTGALMGWFIALSGLMLASVLGLLFAIGAKALSSRDLNAQLPFGPFICLGTLICAFLIFMRIL